MPTACFQCPDSGLCVAVDTEIDDGWTDPRWSEDYDGDNAAAVRALMDASRITGVYVVDDPLDDWPTEAVEAAEHWCRTWKRRLVGRTLTYAAPLLIKAGVEDDDLDDLYC